MKTALLIFSLSFFSFGNNIIDIIEFLNQWRYEKNSEINILTFQNKSDIRENSEFIEHNISEIKKINSEEVTNESKTILEVKNNEDSLEKTESEDVSNLKLYGTGSISFVKSLSNNEYYWEL